MQIIKESFDHLSELEPVFARLALQNVISYLQAEFFSIMKLKDLPKSIVMVEGETIENEKAILALMENLTLDKANTYLDALDKAIDRQIINNLKDTKTKDLGIKLMTDDEFEEMKKNQVSPYQPKSNDEHDESKNTETEPAS